MSDPRIGLTTRLASPAGYDEPLDALSRRWACFLAAALPGVPWTPLPNLEYGLTGHLDAWGINALILTGGGTPGQDPVRDQAETLLLDTARDREWPVLGVCRGMQAMQRYCGGGLCPVAGHVASRHPLDAREDTVNSFHHFGIRAPAPPLIALARDPQGLVEAFRHPVLPWLGLLWHPERETRPDPRDIALFANLFLRRTPCV